MARLRLAFMGTPDFARSSLAAVIAAGHDVVVVYSQPPRRADRGQKPQPSPVQALAQAEHLAVRTPATLRDRQEQRHFADLGLDAAVVAAYGLILPPAILRAPRLGCLNIHASLLPRWRGAAPIQRAIIAGDGETGVTVMQMDEELDTGPILLAERCAIEPSDTGGSLHDKLAALGARLIVTALDRMAAGQLTPTPQPTAGVTYAAMLTREDERVDWRQGADELARRVRALAPRPGAWCEFAGERLKILAAEAVACAGRAGAFPPGKLLDGALTVACGTGALRLLRLQRPGRTALDAREFLRGFALAPGAMLS